MKKSILFILCAVIAVGFVSCSKVGPESEAKKIAADTLTLFDTTTAKLEKAQTAKEASDALVAYAADMKKIQERSNEFQKKYPDFSASAANNDKEMQKKAEASAAAFSGAMTKTMMKYAGSKEILDAVMKLSEMAPKK